MATAQIIVKDGFFANAVGRYIYEVTPTHAILNGWECFVKEDGSIECWSVREYSDGKHSMRYFINPLGFAKLTLKKPGEPIRTLKKGYVIKKGHKLSDGILGLAGDHIDYRYAYFRDNSFQNFLEEFGITAVKHENPNRLYMVKVDLSKGGQYKSTLQTDGIKEEERVDCGYTRSRKKPFRNTYEMSIWYQVTGATWVIYEKRREKGNDYNYSRILYTLVGDVTRLTLPELK